jgi:hypothetical protein
MILSKNVGGNERPLIGDVTLKEVYHALNYDGYILESCLN